MLRDLYGMIKKDNNLEKLSCSTEPEDERYRYIKSINPSFYESFKLLNQYQKSAVVNDDKVMLLNAGVGSGKTTVLVHKVLYLHHIKKVPLSDMVVLTFTNKAANEIKERVMASGAASNTAMKDLSYFGTFHGVARNLLSNILPVEDLGYTKEFSILDENGTEEMFDSIIAVNNLDIKYRKKLEKRLYDYKNGKKLYGSMKQEDGIDEFIYFMGQEKKKRNVMDFDDLIENCGRLLKNGYFKPSWVIIDEFQDTDSSQMEMIDGFIRENTHAFAVGDPNQVIYSWRGSKQDIFNMFQVRYDAALATLPINYRSTATILEAARAFLSSSVSLEGIRDKGTAIIIKKHYNTFNEALYLSETIKKLHIEGVPYKEIGILYRKQKQSSVFEDVFDREGIPHEVSIRKSIKDIPVLYWFLRLIRASLNNKDIESIIYSVSDKRYGIGISSKRASKLIAQYENLKSEKIPELLQKILLFKEWCRGVDICSGLGSKVYEYYDIDNYLSPTSITYEEDKGYVVKYLTELEEYIDIHKTGILEGIKDALEYSILYGNQVVNQTISPENDSVKLMTLHASKGLEFKYVFISGANMGIIPIGSKFDDDEEKRLFFVGITRAKDYLEISYHSNPEDYKALPLPSPFIRMIPNNLIESDEIKSRAGRLTELRKEIKNNISKKQQDVQEARKKVIHAKYGEGFITSESDDMVTVDFEGYGEKSFAKLFCPLKFVD